ncbi:MAG: type II/IV secretion system ATPase subunit [Chloroflexota bacterium]
MAEALLPFPNQRVSSGCDHGPGCPLHTFFLPPPLLEACQEADYLAEYLHLVPMHEVGVPAFYPKLNRGLQKLTHRNLIYPIKEGLFVHVYPDSKGARDHYVTIEPHVTVNLDNILPEVEKRLMEWAEEIGQTETAEEKKRVLLECIDRICTTRKEEAADSRPPVNGKTAAGPKNAPTARQTGSLNRPGGKGATPDKNGASGKSDLSKASKVVVTPRELAAVRYIILRDKVGLGVLQPLLLDPYIEDISCSGAGPMFVEHKIFKSLQCTIAFATLDELDVFVVWLGEWIKRPVTVRNPIVDAVLPDGSRINIVYGREISKRGSNFTIRKFSGTPTSVLELIEFGSMDYLIAAYLSMMLEDGMNMFVVGATASGKTTLLNAITTFIMPEAKIVTIEDTPEVMVPHANWIREVTRAMTSDDTGGAVGMFDLLKAALRQRPELIVVGEIRGEEGRIAFQAMQTGHAVMATFHAASVEKLIQRLTGDPINVPKTYIDNLNVAVIQAAVRLADKKMARRVMSVNEIIGYDASSETFSFLEVFRWNPATDTFEFPGYMNSFLLEERIAPKRGIPPSKRKAIYTELRRRAKIFEKLHKEKGVRGFDEFFAVLAEAHRQKLL